MKPISLILALCVALPGAASGKTLIVVPYPNAATEEVPLVSQNLARELSRVTRAIDRTGGSYTVVPSKIAKTEFIRTGAMTWNYGAPGAYAEQFDAVILIGFGTLAGGVCRPDSLLKGAKASEAIGTGTTKLPTVPILALGENSLGAIPALGWADWADGTGAGICTTGVTGTAPGWLTIATTAGMYQVGSPERWLNSSNVSAWIRNSTPPAGGLRAHVARATVNMDIRTVAQGVPCSDCDSLVQSDTPDTLMFWERPLSHVAGTKPFLFAWAIGGAPCTDSAETIAKPCEGETPVLMMALARLDSLSGGAVFGPKPIRWALTIDGGFSRSGRRNSGGVLAADSASLKATIDSLQALDIPAVLGVNLDSVASYPSEKGWWTKWRRLKFSPQTRYGIDSTAMPAGGLSTWLKPADVWGRWRQRLAYRVSDSLCQAMQDTSIYCGLKSQFFRMDSIPDFAGRTSRFILPPDDDWTPINKFRGLGPDSVLYAASLAGASGIRVNAQEEPSSAYGPNRTTNPRGWYGQQKWQTALGQRIKLLAHSGYSIMGSHSQIDVRSDSAAPYQPAEGEVYGFKDIPVYELGRIWNAGIYPKWQDEDFMQSGIVGAGIGADEPWENVNKPRVDRIVGVRHGSIIRMSAQEFAGDPDGPATRNGWWTIKSMVHAQRVINRLANRNITTMSLPEEIDP